MARAISLDLRRRVCAAISEGLSCREAAARFEVSASSAIRWQAQMRASGDIAPLRNGGDRKSGRIEAEAEFILRQVEERRDITLAELQEKLAAHGTRIASRSFRGDKRWFVPDLPGSAYAAFWAVG